MEKILWSENKLPKTDNKQLAVMALDEINKAYTFHKSFPQYAPTPLVPLKNMADMLGVGSVFIKDESWRFGLNAFKVLGGSFAILSKRVLVEPLGISTTDFCPSLFAAQATPRP